MKKSPFQALDVCSSAQVIATLQHLAAQPNIDYCTLKQFYPVAGQYTLHVLMDNQKHCLIALQDDAYPDDVELADESPFNDELPLYFTERSHRNSPVYFLSLARDCFEQFMRVRYPRATVEAVLLTRSDIINYDDMCCIWESMQVRVFHRVSQYCPLAEVPMDEGKLSQLIDQYNAFMSQLKTTLPECWNVERQMKLQADAAKPAPETEPQNTASADDEDEEHDITAAVNSPTNVKPAHEPIAEMAQQLNAPPPHIAYPYLPDAAERLSQLEGLDDIKQNIDNLLMLARYNNARTKANPQSKRHTLSLHALFLGNPGTGKTTVGKIYASLLHDAGVLSRGHCIIASRSSFIGGVWGSEEKNMHYLLQLAQGGVLFIDEAYLLCSEHPHDPGRVALQQLLSVLSDEDNRDLAIVLAGYQKPMEAMLSLNPGLESRFPSHSRFVFPDFTVEELLRITKTNINAYGYSFTSRAWQTYKSIVTAAYAHRDHSKWGNARYVQNCLEAIYCSHASRCMRNGLEGNQMLSLTSRDLDLLSAIECNNATSRAIGFR